MAKVKLIQNTQMSIDVMYTACRTCYSEKDAGDLWAEIHDEEKMKKLILKVLRSNHMSIAEHVYFTFTIDNISRAASHQLVRHRHCAYSQKSQRYVENKEQFRFEIPNGITTSPKDVLWNKYIEHMNQTQELYNEFIKEGLKPEDARSILPNACHTSIVMSCNLREFIHICNERLCSRAQKEIRDVVKLMVKAILESSDDYSFLKEFFTPKCKTCTEQFDTCKR